MRPRPSLPASEAASAAMPSIRSPSETIAKTRWFWTSAPKCARRKRSAIAMPTPLAKPWPSGPVVISTPGVTWTRSRSGCPGVSEPHWRKFFSSSSGRS